MLNLMNLVYGTCCACRAGWNLYPYTRYILRCDGNSDTVGICTTSLEAVGFFINTMEQ